MRPQVVVSERGICPNSDRAKAAAVAIRGLWGLVWVAAATRPPGTSKPNDLGRSARGGESPVGEWRGRRLARFPSTAGHGKSRGKLGGPPSKAYYPWRPIAHSTVREWWKAPRKGGAKSLKPRAPEQSELALGE